jgi:hypothetical protein
MDIGKYIKINKEMKRCIECNNIIPSDSPRFSVRKFCSKKCNKRHYSLKRYHRIKYSKDYKEYRKSYFKKWVEKNREKFNDYMRDFMREAAPRYKKKSPETNKNTVEHIEKKSTNFNKDDVFKKTGKSSEIVNKKLVLER